MNQTQEQSNDERNVRLFGLAIRTFSFHMLKYACFVGLISFPTDINAFSQLWKTLLDFFPLFLGLLISGLCTISTVVEKGRFQISPETKVRLRILRNVGIFVTVVAFLLFSLAPSPIVLTIAELNRALQVFFSFYFCLALLLHTLDLLSKPPGSSSGLSFTPPLWRSILRMFPVPILFAAALDIGRVGAHFSLFIHFFVWLAASFLDQIYREGIELWRPGSLALPPSPKRKSIQRIAYGLVGCAICSYASNLVLGPFDPHLTSWVNLALIVSIVVMIIAKNVMFIREIRA